MDNKLEIELRAKVDMTIVERLLQKHQVMKRTYQRDTYYKFVSIPENSWIVRLREEDSKYFLTYKSKNVVDDGVWSEVEMGIEKEKADALHHFFLQNGYQVEIEINKKRITLAAGELTINIDEINGLGLFVEVEALAFANEIVRTHKKIRNTLKTIGVPSENIIEKGYVTLMKEVTHD